MNKGFDAPLVSVVMAVYNGESYLPAALESILQQTYRNLEIILINDGSTDGSSKILSDFSRRDSRIILVDQENSGLTRALIRGMGLATGQFVARMDADDYSHPARIEKQLDVLLNDPSKDAVSCGINYIYDDGAIVPQGVPEREDLVPWFMNFYNEIAGHGQIFMRRDAYLDSGGYDAQFKYAQDYDLFSRMFKRANVAFIPEHLYDYRISGQSITNKRWREQQEFSYIIMGRSLTELTGNSLPLIDLQLLRQFWVQKGEVELSANNVRHVNKLIFDIFNSYISNIKPNETTKMAIQRAIAIRWAEWSFILIRERPRDALNFFYKSFRWKPRVAIKMGGRILVKLTS